MSWRRLVRGGRRGHVPWMSVCSSTLRGEGHSSTARSVSVEEVTRSATGNDPRHCAGHCTRGVSPTASGHPTGLNVTIHINTTHVKVCVCSSGSSSASIGMCRDGTPVSSMGRCLLPGRAQRRSRSTGGIVVSVENEQSTSPRVLGLCVGQTGTDVRERQGSEAKNNRFGTERAPEQVSIPRPLLRGNPDGRGRFAAVEPSAAVQRVCCSTACFDKFARTRFVARVAHPTMGCRRVICEVR